MATTKIWAVRSRLDHLVDYVSNTDKTINPAFNDLQSIIEYAGEDYKTEKRYYVGGINSQMETAYTRYEQRFEKLSLRNYNVSKTG